ncbi:unnamed protein product [Candidula unifasciata]|uniref:Ribosomal RNA large subunit methyltransferase K/L-like methyltransferase domain-containing protein n=1 Tax=Candidula unifasciata TaxID=100452 RepID=A0A8S4A4A9_9EUPU|nr:unnamed protein product [Candidula unifasciata]
MNPERESISFFATAGRGTEEFAADEIRKKVMPGEVSTRDGKVFFRLLSSAIELNIKKILALRSVERVFVGITDYNNSTYITNKRTFLDKLMCSVTSQENISNAVKVLADILSQSHKNKTESMSVSTCTQNTSVTTLPGHDNQSLSVHLWPIKKSCVNEKAADFSLSRQKFENSSSDRVSPAEKYQKLDVNILHTTEVSVAKTECDRRTLSDKASHGLWQASSGCECTDGLNETPECDRRSDHNCVTQAAVDCSEVRQVRSDCDISGLNGCAGQIYSSHKMYREKDTVNNCRSTVYHACSLNCYNDDKDNQQEIHKQDSIKEDTNDSTHKESLSFRMSIKCSGKVSRWLNTKKLSRDLGWRVARATGWRVDLRKPQYEVCVHISDDYVTVGVPLTRFPLSKRVYLVDSGLRAPIAWIMSQLCSIKAGDIVLDPMCGKATILIEASSDVKDAWFVGSDRDSSQLEKALQNVITCSHPATVSLLEADGLNMPYRDGCVDVVVCDAPFNHKHLLTLAPEMFYSKFVREIYRVLRPQGSCVLLVSEQLQHVVLSIIQGTEGTQQPAPCPTSEASSQGRSKDPDTHFEHDKATESLVGLTFVSSHYVKLGETHACILVLHKES